jgi:hypothetical protein
VPKINDYCVTLRTFGDWDPFLLAHSNLPGPRGNLELAQAAAEEGTPTDYERWLAYTPDLAPANSPGEFLAFCGILGLGVLLAEGDTGQLQALRAYAADPRWRSREAVAMALQRLGDVDMPRMLHEMRAWAGGSLLEQRAAAAALCEPRLLRSAEAASATLHILDDITSSIKATIDRRSPDFRTLRQALGYCWSVAVAALPGEGLAMLERWLADTDPDIRWVMRENLKKARLKRLDAAWLRAQLARLAGA